MRTIALAVLTCGLLLAAEKAAARNSVPDVRVFGILAGISLIAAVLCVIAGV